MARKPAGDLPPEMEPPTELNVLRGFDPLPGEVVPVFGEQNTVMLPTTGS